MTVSENDTASAPAVPSGRANDFQSAFRTYVKAGYPILYVVTAEEDRALDLMTRAAAEPDLARRKPFTWSVSRGLCTSDQKPVDSKTQDPRRVLPYLQELQHPGLFVLQDFHPYIDERAPSAALTVRQLRDLVGPFKASAKTLVILSPVLKIPPELEKDITVLDLGLPDDAELAALLNESLEQIADKPNIEIHVEGEGRERIVRALSGLTRLEAENALFKLAVTHNRIDPEDVDVLLGEKEQIIRKSGMLEFYSSPERFGSIGGLDLLKLWLRKRSRAFSEAARLFGLPNPRGLLLVGVPGCGKSLTAKAIAAEWKMPLLKFDLGKVFAALVGQAEENMRRALKMAEAVAPCILWIDEIEKGLAGSRGGAGDGGVGTRVFGTLLTWMEEKRQQVFVVATANDIDGMPPELLRKGRFDEVFFIDLPGPQERAAILAIHLTLRHRDYREFDLTRFAGTTEGFSGAELEQVIVSALYEAFAEGEKTKLADHHIDAAVQTTVPLSQSMAEKVRILREEARTKWRLASSPGDAAVQDVAMAETPPVAKKQKRVFEA